MPVLPIIIVLLTILFTASACDLASVGQIGLSTQQELKIIGQRSGEHFGSSVRFAGDMNGDGLSDVAIGAPANAQAGVGAGAVYLFTKPLKSDVDGIQILGAPGEAFGAALAALGDIDEDGFDDLAISAPNATPPKVYIFRGHTRTGLSGIGPLTSNDADLVISAASSTAGIDIKGFASSVASAGDVNRDGRLDLMISAPRSHSGNHVQGLVFIFYGGLSLNGLGTIEHFSLTSANADLTLKGEVDSDFGQAAAPAGDTNGDFGKAASRAKLFGDDLLIGAPSSGTAYLLLGVDGVAGTKDILDYPRLRKITPTASTHFGQSLAAVGDANDDGLDEFAVGFDGGLLVYQGVENIGFTIDLPLTIVSKLDADDGFAFAMAGGRGVRQGALPGLLVGAPSDFEPEKQAGSAYFFATDVFSDVGFSTTLEALASATKHFRGLDHKPISLRQLGYSVDLGGDVNDDGFNDALIGMPFYNGSGPSSGAILVEY